jgi:Uma2 family endonuclease
VRDVRSAHEDYRIPEWVFVGHEREDLLHSEHGYVDDGPDLILEVRSPGDETDAKLPFYERVGTRECLIVDRDSRHVVLLRLIGERLLPTTPNVDGWLYSEALHACFRTDERQGLPALRVRLELTGAEHFV